MLFLGMELTDAALLLAYRRGDLDAFTTLYDRYKDRLFFYARTLTEDAGIAEDVIQEAFVRLLRVEPGGAGESLSPLLFTMVRNLAADARRRAVVRDRIHAARPSAARTDDPASGVGDLLETLPEDQREAVFLKIYSGLTFAEIGEVTGLKLQTVASRYRAALEKLASHLGGGTAP
jgi:RNA polymerase sigma-70 factor, ECF subfamily